MTLERNKGRQFALKNPDIIHGHNFISPEKKHKINFALNKKYERKAFR